MVKESGLRLRDYQVPGCGGETITGSSKRKFAKLRESSALLRLAGAQQNRTFFLHKSVVMHA